MAKEKILSREILPCQTGMKTLSFAPVWEQSPVETFQEGITGKIRVGIYDFSKGRGDNSQYASFNLDRKTLHYIASILPGAMLFKQNFLWKGEKFYGAYGTDEGGFSRVVKMEIARMQQMKDKDGVMRDSSYPWKLSIETGKAKPVRRKGGGVSYDGKTYQRSVWVVYFLTDEDFNDRIEVLMQSERRFLNYVDQNGLYKNGIEAVVEIEARGTYSDENGNVPIPPEAPAVVEAPMEAPITPTPAAPVPTPAPAPTEANTETPTKEFTMKVVSDFQALEGGRAVAHIESCGKTVACFFPEELVNAVKEKAGKEFKGIITKEGKNYLLLSLA